VKTTVLWYMTLLGDMYRRFRRTYWMHHQGAFTGSCPRRQLSLQARQWELHIWPMPLCLFIASPSHCPVFTRKPSWNSSSDKHLVVWVVTWFTRTATDEREQV